MCFSFNNPIENTQHIQISIQVKKQNQTKIPKLKLFL